MISHHAKPTPRIDLFLFALLIGIHLIPVWVFPYFPSQDGPTHLATATILADYNRPEHWAFREYFQLSGSWNPNWLFYFFATPLLKIFSAIVLEKLTLTAYILLLPLSIYYLLRSLAPRAAGVMAALSFPLLYSFPLQMGFYNYCLSLPLSFFLIGYWIRQRGRWGWWNLAVLFFLTIPLYFSHLVSFAATLMTLVILTVWEMVLEKARPAEEKRPAPIPFGASAFGRHLIPFLMFFPTLFLAFLFLVRQGFAGGFRPAPGKLVVPLLTFRSLVTFDPRAIYFSSVFVCLLAGSAVYLLIVKTRLKNRHLGDAFLAVTGFFILLYFVAPDELAGGGFLIARLNLLPYLGLLIWIGSQSPPRLLRHLLKAGAVTISLSILGLNIPRYAELNRYLREYLSCREFLEPNSTVLPLSFAHRGRRPDGTELSPGIGPFRHAAGYLTSLRGVVDLANYQASTNYFPIAYRPSLDPYRHLAAGPPGGLEAQPPAADFLTYGERTGGSVDYVLLWGLSNEDLDYPQTGFILNQLRQGYDLIFVSSPREMVRLYRKNKKTGDPSGDDERKTEGRFGTASAVGHQMTFFSRGSQGGRVYRLPRDCFPCL